MKTRSILFSVLLAAAPICMQAQDDDLYFTPSKSDKVARQLESRKESYDRPTYYCGSNRSVDEYNRMGKLKSYYQKIGTDSLGNDILEFHVGDGTCGRAEMDSTITIYPGSERYYDDDDSDFAYSRRMGRFDGFYGYYDPFYYGSYWGPSYWRSYYGWYDPWYDPWYGPYYTGWYGGWYSPWHYGYYGWNSPYWGWGGWYTPGVHIAYNGPTGTRNHSTIGGFRTGTNNRWGSIDGRSYNASKTRGTYGNRRPSYDNRNNDNGIRYQQRPSYNQDSFGGNQGSFGGGHGSFGGGSGFGSSRGSFGGGGRGGFGSRR